ncbi:F0F1 ATP synthase subunit epsilon [Clostridium sp. KNHs214]|uniref:F0F1 ATP synthase subunit epsilon n=1 Tax=Clostridium sp. KNHs214 TaxID=1540257 RepID=UPI0005590459|nr:F0F1 ATP synthase subunit epsilon [Clostridium sp. KNHs214]
MEGVLNLLIITPEKEFYNGNVKEIYIETLSGHMGILPGRLPIIALLKPTITVFKDEKGKEFRTFTSSGMLEVENNKVKMLCDACEWPKNIDFNRAEAAKKRAEERLSKKEENVDIKRAQMALARALARLKLKDI